MSRLVLTDRSVASVRHQAERREYPDHKLTGLYLIVHAAPSERKTWAVRTRVGGKPAKLSIPGAYPAVGLATAREAAGRLLECVALGVDPRVTDAVADAPAGTMAALVAKFEQTELPKYKGSKARTVAELKRINATWGPRPAHTIRKPDVVAFRDAQIAAKRGDGAVRNTMKFVKKFFGWAEERGAIDQSPAAGLKNPKDKPRERVLTDQELATVWNADAPKEFRALVRLLALTGCRVGEIAGLKRAWVNCEYINIPAGATKTGKPHNVFLVPAARAILAEFEGPGEYVLTNRSRPLDLNGGNRDLIETPTVADWQLRDLRRTMRSGLSELGVRFEVAEAILNHARKGVHGVYDKSELKQPMREAWELWGQHVAKLSGGNVTKLAA
ncbi:MAG TPA: integrase family protein [Steroidobacteraceae bacterium]|jgi:integrase|nr:integrase family protein [Steroidobacteraceae bacterium]